MGRIWTRPRTPVGAALRNNSAKPLGALALNKNHPLYRDVLLFLDFNQGIGDFRDLTAGRFATNNGCTWGRSPYGMAATYENDGGVVPWDLGSNYGALTYIGIYENVTGSEWDSTGYLVDGRSGSGNYWSVTNGSGGQQNFAGRTHTNSLYVDRGRVVIGVSQISTNTSLFGKNFTTGVQSSSSNAGNQVSIGDGITLFRYHANNVGPFLAPVHYLMIFQRWLTAEQIFDIGRNPGQLLIPASDAPFRFSDEIPPATGEDNAILMASNF
jgi:hypothetical protein